MMIMIWSALIAEIRLLVAGENRPTVGHPPATPIFVGRKFIGGTTRDFFPAQVRSLAARRGSCVTVEYEDKKPDLNLITKCAG